MEERGSNGIHAGKKLLAEDVFLHIGKMIVEEELPAGHRIRDIEVADTLHVSRTPVREALQRLERIGLVTMFPSRYTEVTRVTDAVIEQSIEFAGYQAGVLSRMSVKRMTDAEREHAADLVDTLIDSIDDAIGTSNARWALFSYLAEHAQNALHRAFIDEASMALFRNLRHWVVAPEHREDLLEIYGDFRVAIRSADADAAEHLARAMHFVD